ncbi:MAG TPA: type II toxin-antitoxin system VapC family toxin [Caulobacter sp.]|nr:type II toxin-antitoxin system VapC family toxin [Caulobacter sp.]
MSGLILDSNALIWWLEDAPRIRRSSAAERIATDPLVMVSIVTPWELWIKAASGRLGLPGRFNERLPDLGLEIISPTLRDARLATALPPIHKDPFDRMIVAQALNRDAAIVTSDRKLRDYGVDVILL